MKTKTKKVYYCEYCKKHGLHSGYMLSHEESCKMNPQRVCNLNGCISHPEIFSRVIEKYSNAYEVTVFEIDRSLLGVEKKTEIKYIPDEYKNTFGIFVSPADWKHKVTWLKDINFDNLYLDCEYCPVCTLSALMLTRLQFMPGFTCDMDELFRNWNDAQYQSRP